MTAYQGIHRAADAVIVCTAMLSTGAYVAGQLNTEAVPLAEVLAACAGALLVSFTLRLLLQIVETPED